MNGVTAKSTAKLRGDKRARTRRRLIEATLEVAAERGLAGASLDAIAARAGMTKGAIYSNFTGRADLLVAARASKAINLINPDDAGAPPARLADLAQQLVAVIERARPEARFLGEYLAHALADPELGARVAADYERQFREIGEALARDLGEALSVEPREVPVIVQSLALGFLYQSLLTPKAVTRTAVLAAFDALARGLTRD
jgi:AcrR family transcriptional regulator